MSSTRLEIEQAALEILGQFDPEVSMVPVPFDGTIASDGLTLTSTLLDRGTINANRYDGRIIRIVEDATALAFNPAVTVTGAHTVAITTLTVSSTTDIRVGFILELNSSEKVLVRAVPTATTLTVTRGYAGTTAAAYVGAETVRYDGQLAVGVDDAGFAAGGVLTISPNFPDTTQVSGGPYAAGSFHMYPRGITPELLLGEINRVLLRTEAPYIWAPSLVFDSDFAENNLAYWDDVLTPTKSFITTVTAPWWQRDFLGNRLLSVVTNAADEGVTTELIFVDEGETLYLSVFVSTQNYSTAGMKVIARDNTAGVTIESVTDIQNELWTNVLLQFAPPANCESVRIRFLSGDSVGEFYIAPPVIVQSGNYRQYETPSWFQRESQLISFLRLRPDQSSRNDGTNAYIAASQFEEVALPHNFLRSDMDINSFRVGFRGDSSAPLYALVMRPFESLAYDTATTKADKDFVAAKVVSNILRKRKDKEWIRWAQIAAQKARTRGYGSRDIVIREQVTTV